MDAATENPGNPVERRLREAHVSLSKALYSENEAKQQLEAEQRRSATLQSQIDALKSSQAQMQKTVGDLESCTAQMAKDKHQLEQRLARESEEHEALLQTAQNDLHAANVDRSRLEAVSQSYERERDFCNAQLEKSRDEAREQLVEFGTKAEKLEALVAARGQEVAALHKRLTAAKASEQESREAAARFNFKLTSFMQKTVSRNNLAALGALPGYGAEGQSIDSRSDKELKRTMESYAQLARQSQDAAHRKVRAMGELIRDQTVEMAQSSARMKEAEQKYTALKRELDARQEEARLDKAALGRLGRLVEFLFVQRSLSAERQPLLNSTERQDLERALSCPESAARIQERVPYWKSHIELLDTNQWLQAQLDQRQLKLEHLETKYQQLRQKSTESLTYMERYEAEAARLNRRVFDLEAEREATQAAAKAAEEAAEQAKKKAAKVAAVEAIEKVVNERLRSSDQSSFQGSLQGPHDTAELTADESAIKAEVASAALAAHPELDAQVAAAAAATADAQAAANVSLEYLQAQFKRHEDGLRADLAHANKRITALNSEIAVVRHEKQQALADSQTMLGELKRARKELGVQLEQETRLRTTHLAELDKLSNTISSDRDKNAMLHEKAAVRTSELEKQVASLNRINIELQEKIAQRDDAAALAAVRLEALERDLRQEKTELESTARARDETLKMLTLTRQAHESEAKEQRELVAQTQKEAAAAAQQAKHQQAQAQAQVQQLEGTVRDLQSKLTEASKAHAEELAKAAEGGEAKAASDAARDAARDAELAAARTELTQVRAELATAQSKLEQAQKVASEAKAQAAQLLETAAQAAASEAQRDTERAAELNNAKAELEKSQADLKQAQQAAAEAEAQAAQLRDSSAHANTDVVHSAELETARTALAAAQTELAAAKAEQERAHQAAAEAKTQAAAEAAARISSLEQELSTAKKFGDDLLAAKAATSPTDGESESELIASLQLAKRTAEANVQNQQLEIERLQQRIKLLEAEGEVKTEAELEAKAKAEPAQPAAPWHSMLDRAQTSFFDGEDMRLEWQERVEQSQKQVDDLQNELDATKALHEQLTVERNELATNHNASTQRIANLEAELGRVKAEDATSKQRIEHLEDEVNRISDEHTDAETKCGALETQLEASKVELAATLEKLQAAGKELEAANKKAEAAEQAAVQAAKDADATTIAKAVAEAKAEAAEATAKAVAEAKAEAAEAVAKAEAKAEAAAKDAAEAAKAEAEKAAAAAAPALESDDKPAGEPSDENKALADELKALVDELEAAGQDAGKIKKVLELAQKDVKMRLKQEFQARLAKRVADECVKAVEKEREEAQAKFNEERATLESSLKKQTELKTKLKDTQIQNLTQKNEELKNSIRQLKGGANAEVVTMPDGTTKAVISQPQAQLLPQQAHQHAQHAQQKKKDQRSGSDGRPGVSRGNRKRGSDGDDNLSKRFKN